jgi:hypothetical protein
MTKKEPKERHYIETLRYTSPHFTTLHYTSPHFTTLHHTSLHFTTFLYTSPQFTTLHHTSLHFTTLHHTSPHFTHGDTLNILGYLKSNFFGKIYFKNCIHPQSKGKGKAVP